MQKYLKLLNFRLDVVVKDVCGLTGLRIIAEICKGNLNPEELAKHRHYNCRKSEQEIAKTLRGNNRADFLFGLIQEYESYLFYQKKIDECDKQIAMFLKAQINSTPGLKKLKVEKKPYKRVNKNATKNLDMNQVSFQYIHGIDLMAIEGVSHSTVLSIISEIGYDGFKKFPTATAFCFLVKACPE